MKKEGEPRAAYLQGESRSTMLNHFAPLRQVTIPQPERGTSRRANGRRGKKEKRRKFSGGKEAKGKN